MINEGGRTRQTKDIAAKALEHISKRSITLLEYRQNSDENRENLEKEERLHPSAFPEVLKS